MRYDRDELLARTDLPVLADELLGGHKRNGHGARWPSPVPGHPQTGATPPMSIYRDRAGGHRWHCFATGTGGTAIDLVATTRSVTIGEAIEWLAARAQLTQSAVPAPDQPRRFPTAAASTEPSAALGEYVAACAELLWQPAGTRIRRWLTEERGLDPDVLALNQVGADPGPRGLPRPAGLPRRGPAAVFPVHDEHRTLRYLQARYLIPPPGRGKYDNPTARHATNPRLAHLHPSRERPGSATIVTEGIPDSLAAAAAGYPAIAVLGAALPDTRVAERLAQQPGLLVVAFDADPAGRTGAERLVGLLADRGRRDAIDLSPRDGDLNDWARRAGPGFADQLRHAIRLTLCGRNASRDNGRGIA